MFVGDMRKARQAITCRRKLLISRVAHCAKIRKYLAAVSGSVLKMAIDYTILLYVAAVELPSVLAAVLLFFSMPVLMIFHSIA